jgi:hypothetical protein
LAFAFGLAFALAFASVLSSLLQRVTLSLAIDAVSALSSFSA